MKSKMTEIVINVCCAVIRNDDDEILVVQRGKDTDHPFKWEFPGGKVCGKENAEDCIIRELKEELEMDVIVFESLSDVRHDYGLKKIKLIPFVCDTLIDLPILNEHIAFRWLAVDELLSVDFSEADIPVAREYVDIHGSERFIAEQRPVYNGTDTEKIRELLLGDNSINACQFLGETAVEDTNVLKTLIDFSFSDEKTLAFRASWSLSKAEGKVPGLARPYYTILINSLGELKYESVIRAFLKILNQTDFNLLSEKQHGILADRCFSWLSMSESAIAVKAYSMETLYKLTNIYPELRNELRSSISIITEDGSAAIKSRGYYITERIRKDIIAEKR